MRPMVNKIGRIKYNMRYLLNFLELVATAPGFAYSTGMYAV